MSGWWITAGSASAALVLSPTLGNPRLGTEFTPAYDSGDCNSVSAGAECLADVFNVDAAELSAVLSIAEREQHAQRGLLAGSYTTIFNADLSGGTIVNTGSTSVYVPVVLPDRKGWLERASHLLLRISALRGMGLKQWPCFLGLWPNQGSISHVALYGTNPTVCTGCNPDLQDVPEPTTLGAPGPWVARRGPRSPPQVKTPSLSRQFPTPGFSFGEPAFLFWLQCRNAANAAATARSGPRGARRKPVGPTIACWGRVPEFSCVSEGR